MTTKWPSHRAPTLAAALLLLAFTTSASAQSVPTPAAQAEAVLTVIVPPDAQVFFDGAPTTQVGSERRFVSPLLEVGTKYSYDIRPAGGKTADRCSRRERSRFSEVMPSASIS